MGVPQIYNLIDDLAVQSPQYDMSGINTSADEGNSDNSSGMDLHWHPSVQPQPGIGSMPDIQPFDLNQAMQSQQQQQQAPQAPSDPMQQYSDQLLKAPDMLPPSGYDGGGTPSGGPTQTMGQQITAPFRDALSSLFHPGGASRMAQPQPQMQAPTQLTRGQDMGQQPGPAPQQQPMPQGPNNGSMLSQPDVQQMMLDRYKNSAGLTDQMVASMMKDARGQGRANTIDNFFGRVVAPIVGATMSAGRHGNRYAMPAMNQLSQQLDARAAGSGANQMEMLKMVSGLNKQQFDQMVASDPNSAKNLISMINAQANQTRATGYNQSVGNNYDLGQQRIGLGQDTNNIKRDQMDQDTQNQQAQIAEKKREFNQQFSLEQKKTEQAVLNGQMTRQEQQARMGHIGDQLRIANMMLDQKGQQLQADLWKTKFNAGQGMDRLMYGQGQQNSRMANEQVFNKESGKMEPKMSAGFTDEYGTPAPKDDSQQSANPLDSMLSGLGSMIFGQPATASNSASADTSAQRYSPSDIDAMKAELARRRAANGQ